MPASISHTTPSCRTNPVSFPRAGASSAQRNGTTTTLQPTHVANRIPASVDRDGGSYVVIGSPEIVGHAIKCLTAISTLTPPELHQVALLQLKNVTSSALEVAHNQRDQQSQGRLHALQQPVR